MDNENRLSQKVVRVLLAEDDNNVGHLLKILLEDEGMLVTWVKCGQSAVRELQARGADQFDVLVTDLYMPNLDGVGLVDWVSEHHPQLPALVITATHSDAITARQASGKVKIIYAKPLDDVTMDTFIDEIRQIGRSE